MENCHMFIKTSIEARDINLFKLTSIESELAEVPLESLRVTDSIESKNIHLTFIGGNKSDSSL